MNTSSHSPCTPAAQSLMTLGCWASDYASACSKSGEKPGVIGTRSHIVRYIDPVTAKAEFEFPQRKNGQYPLSYRLKVFFGSWFGQRRGEFDRAKQARRYTECITCLNSLTPQDVAQYLELTELSQVQLPKFVDGIKNLHTLMENKLQVKVGTPIDELKKKLQAGAKLYCATQLQNLSGPEKEAKVEQLKKRLGVGTDGYYTEEITSTVQNIRQKASRGVTWLVGQARNNPKISAVFTVVSTAALAGMGLSWNQKRVLKNMYKETQQQSMPMFLFRTLIGLPGFIVSATKSDVHEAEVHAGVGILGFLTKLISKNH